MIKTTAAEREVVKAPGAAGFIMKESLITPEQLGAHCRMFSHITLKKGCEIGYHEHHEEGEAYYILSGKGIYEEDKKTIEVEAGDVTFCEDGHAHGLRNVSDEDLEMIALILKK